MSGRSLPLLFKSQASLMKAFLNNNFFQKILFFQKITFLLKNPFFSVKDFLDVYTDDYKDNNAF
jgi:hypothetical protein